MYVVWAALLAVFAGYAAYCRRNICMWTNAAVCVFGLLGTENTAESAAPALMFGWAAFMPVAARLVPLIIMAGKNAGWQSALALSAFCIGTGADYFYQQRPKK
ncbi:MAG: hypothetical protein EBZ60_08290 [Betaproteobacteria bacterium]|nr:hypothetical protein [Betaproteobacteria bacterium]